MVERQELYQAASEGKIEPTITFLDRLGGVDALAMSLDRSRNVSALLIASEKGHHELVRVLIRKGANVNFLSDINESPLLNACIFGRDKVVEELLVGGANPNQVAGLHIPDTLNPALPVAAAYAHGKLGTKLICRLLDMTIDVNPSFDGRSTFSRAVEKGGLEVVKCLLAKGACISKIRLDQAVKYKQVGVLKLFFEKNIPDDILMNGARLEKTRGMFLLILQDAKANAPDQDYFKRVMRDTSSAFRKVYDWISDKEPCILEVLFPYFLDKSTTSIAGTIKVFRGDPGDWTYATPFKSQAAGASAGLEIPHNAECRADQFFLHFIFDP